MAKKIFKFNKKSEKLMTKLKSDLSSLKISGSQHQGEFLKIELDRLYGKTR